MSEVAPTPPHRVLLVVEAAADAHTVACLLDRLWTETDDRGPRVAKEALPQHRTWVELDQRGGSGLPHITWTGIAKRGPRVLGHGAKGATKNSYALAARRAILVAQTARPIPTAVVLIVDTDAQQDRARGLDEARQAELPALSVVIGAADPKREAWVLNAFRPENKSEEKTLRELRQALGFDPCADAHRLRGRRGETRDIKRVHAALVTSDDERESAALCALPLAELRTRGANTGLAAFLDDASSLRDLVAPE